MRAAMVEGINVLVCGCISVTALSNRDTRRKSDRNSKAIVGIYECAFKHKDDSRLYFLPSFNKCAPTLVVV